MKRSSKVVLFTAAPAAVAWAGNAEISHGGSTATYSDSHNQVATSDRASDGLGTRVRWNYQAGGGDALLNNSGYGTSKSKTFGTVFAAVNSISIASCLTNNGVDQGCSGYTAYTSM